MARSRERSPLGSGISTDGACVPGTHLLARTGSHSRACDSTAVHRAVWERERSMSPGRAGERPVPRTHPSSWAPLPLCSASADTPGLWELLLTALSCSLANHCGMTQLSQEMACQHPRRVLPMTLRSGTSLPRHGPPGSVSCCSARSVGRDGASPSPEKSPSQLEWGQGKKVTLASLPTYQEEQAPG